MINDFNKNEFNNDLKNTDYVTRKIGIRILVIIVLLTIVGGAGGVIYTKTIGKAQKNAEREVFKESVAYTEQAASFLAKSYKEYNDAETKADKKTVMEYVIMR